VTKVIKSSVHRISKKKLFKKSSNGFWKIKQADPEIIDKAKLYYGKLNEETYDKRYP
jgi:hypothetical protein